MYRVSPANSVQLPDVLKPPEGFDVRSKPMAGVDSVSVHEVHRAGRLLGTVCVYDEGMRRLGFLNDEGKLPLDVSKLVGEEGAELFAKLSMNRMRPSVSLLSGLAKPDQCMTANGGVSLKDRTWFPHEESFRRHSLVWQDSSGKHQWVDFKIPGADREHHNIEEVNFTAPVRIYQRFLAKGREPLMLCPLIMVTIPPHIRQELYGELRTEDNSGKPFSTRYVIMQHFDGMRLIRFGKGSPLKHGIVPREYVDKVSENTGIPTGKILSEAALTPLRVSSMAHETGYLLEDDLHFGNYILCSDGVTRSAGDFGGAKSDFSDFLLDHEMTRLVGIFTYFRKFLPPSARNLLDKPWEAYGRDPYAMEDKFLQYHMLVNRDV